MDSSIFQFHCLNKTSINTCYLFNLAGILGATSRHSPFDRGPLHLHFGSTLRGNALTAH